MAEIAGYRNRLTHFYDEVSSGNCLGATGDDLGDIEALAEEIRRAAARLATAQ